MFDNLNFPPPTLKNLLKLIYPVASFLHSIKLPSPPKLIKPLISLVFCLFFLYSLFYHYILKDLPPPSTLATRSVPLTTHIRDRQGRELYKIYASQNRTLIHLTDLPPHLVQAVLSIEDKDFYSHDGYSVKGFLRALWKIITNRHFEGGSTITQQLVKTSLLSPEKTLQRKLRELILAIWVETKYTKDQILEMYLNRVSFGGSTYGIEEASQTYFGISARDLSLAQASFLAGLPAAPTTYSPYGAHPELAKSRQAHVLEQMVVSNYITWDNAQAASSQELTFKPPTIEIAAPHFVMYVRELLSQKYGPDVVEQGGLDVITSLDLDLQEQFQKTVTEELAKISYLHITNGASLVTKPKTGEILAMIGSKDYFDIKNDGNVNVTLRPRQPGSSIKPINYALAFTQGFTPSSLIDDSPITYHISGQPPYTPSNYDRKYHGRVTLRTALASSYNIPAVKLLSANGVKNMIQLGKNLGITTWTDTTRFGLSLTLGGGEVTMLDLTTAYGVFANSGRKVDLNPILSVRNSTGRMLEDRSCVTDYSCPSTEILPSAVAFLVNDILSDNVARSPTFGSNSLLRIPQKTVAVKTGTTNNLRDNWTIGYTPDFLVSVWVGNNDNTPMSYVASGITGASPIWHKIMSHLLEKNPNSSLFVPPSEIVKLNICPTTGQLSCDACRGRSEYFVAGTEPTTHCSVNISPAPSPDNILRGASTQALPTPSKVRRASPRPRLRR